MGVYIPPCSNVELEESPRASPLDELVDNFIDIFCLLLHLLYVCNMKQRRLTNKEKSELFTKYETGKFTAVDLAKEYPISSTAISALLKRHGYKAKSQSELQRKYNIDETFFDVIDTEEKAYFLGFLYADGYNNTDRNSVNLSLKESDKDILIRLNNLIQPDKPLQYVEFKKETRGYKNSSNQYRLAIANKHISERLTELGCCKNKTHIITFPSEEQVPKHLQRHFTRGYFDGDGCVSNRVFSMVGTELFLITVQEIMIDKLGLTKTKLDKRHKKRENNITSIRYCGSSNLRKIMDWFYTDATIYLDRKYEKFKNYVE